MRIDSGLNGYYYQGRLQYDQTEAEDTATETVVKSRPNAGSNAVVSSTLLSSSLASALWVIEGGRKTDAGSAAAQASEAVGVDEQAVATPAEQIEAYYLEYADIED